MSSSLVMNQHDLQVRLCESDAEEVSWITAQFPSRNMFSQRLQQERGYIVVIQVWRGPRINVKLDRIDVGVFKPVPLFLADESEKSGCWTSYITASKHIGLISATVHRLILCGLYVCGIDRKYQCSTYIVRST